MIKYCSHCRKDDHNDIECWSTRIVPSTPDRVWSIPPYAGKPPFPPAPMSDELRVALLKAGLRHSDIS